MYSSECLCVAYVVVSDVVVADYW